MRRSLLSTLLLTLVLTSLSCTKEAAAPAPDPGNCEDMVYKGRLEIKGLCMNYTIKLLEGSMDPSKVQASWTDPVTGKTHKNVFALQNICDFPADIREGDEFYFRLPVCAKQSCVVCQAYRAKPEIETAITVLPGYKAPAGAN